MAQSCEVGKKTVLEYVQLNINSLRYQHKFFRSQSPLFWSGLLVMTVKQICLLWLFFFFVPFLVLNQVSYCELSAYIRFFSYHYFGMWLYINKHTRAHTHTHTIASIVSPQSFPNISCLSGLNGHRGHSASDILLLLAWYFPEVSSLLPITMGRRKFASFTMTRSILQGFLMCFKEFMSTLCLLQKLWPISS